MSLKREITERERKMLVMICEQKTTKEISYDMGLRKRTIERVRTDLMRKTESKSMVGLVIHAIKHGIYEL